jgi:hypothetical protein
MQEWRPNRPVEQHGNTERPSAPKPEPKSGVLRESIPQAGGPLRAGAKVTEVLDEAGKRTEAPLGYVDVIVEGKFDPAGGHGRRDATVKENKIDWDRG